MHSQYAQLHVVHMRKKKGLPTWDDVADAYDMGLVHATSRTGSQIRHLRQTLRAIQILNAPEPPSDAVR